MGSGFESPVARRKFDLKFVKVSVQAPLAKRKRKKGKGGGGKKGKKNKKKKIGWQPTPSLALFSICPSPRGEKRKKGKGEVGREKRISYAFNPGTKGK